MRWNQANLGRVAFDSNKKRDQHIHIKYVVGALYGFQRSRKLISCFFPKKMSINEPGCSDDSA